MSYTSNRTQILIPRNLREEIEKHRSVTGETLSEYLRRSAIERIAREKKKKADLKKLADEVIGSIKHGEGGWAGVKDTYKYVRKMRQEEDEHWLKRRAEAKKD